MTEFWLTTILVSMKTIPLSEVKMKLSQLVDEVHERDEEIVITKNGRPVAVLLSSDQVDSYRESRDIESSPELMDEIRQGLAALGKGEAELYTLAELFD